MENMNWPTASVIVGILIIIGQLLRDFLSGKYSKENRDSVKQDLRVSDEKWKRAISVQVGKLQEGQDHILDMINRFKDDVQNDVNAINKRIDDFIKYLTGRIDNIKK